MGIYDREYYRREGPSFLGSLAEQGRVTNWLIALNVVFFLIQFVTRSAPDDFGIVHEPFTRLFDLNVREVLNGQLWRLLTYAFLHDTSSIWHLLFNMLMLFWFGRQVEDVIGGREYLWLYLAAALASGAGFVGASLLGLHGAQTASGTWIYPSAVGASGAVTAVLVLAACYNPRQMILVMFILPVPIWAFVIFFVAADTFQLLGRHSQGIATSAHVAGALFGYLYFKGRWRLSAWTGWFSGWQRARHRPRLRIFREESEEVTPQPAPIPSVPAQGAIQPQPRPAPTRLMDDEHLEAQVDAILAKIARVGMEGLTDNERQTLLKASEQIKRRRS